MRGPIRAMFDFLAGRNHERHEEQRQVNEALTGELARTRVLVEDLSRQNEPLRTTDAQLMEYLRRTAQVADRARKH